MKFHISIRICEIKMRDFLLSWGENLKLGMDQGERNRKIKESIKKGRVVKSGGETYVLVPISKKTDGSPRLLFPPPESDDEEAYKEWRQNVLGIKK